MTATEHQLCGKLGTGHSPSLRLCRAGLRDLVLETRTAPGDTAGKVLLENHRWTSELGVREAALPGPPLTEDGRAEGALHLRLSERSYDTGAHRQAGEEDQAKQGRLERRRWKEGWDTVAKQRGWGQLTREEPRERRCLYQV